MKRQRYRGKYAHEIAVCEDIKRSGTYIFLKCYGHEMVIGPDGRYSWRHCDRTWTMHNTSKVPLNVINPFIRMELETMGLVLKIPKCEKKVFGIKPWMFIAKWCNGRVGNYIPTSGSLIDMPLRYLVSFMVEEIYLHGELVVKSWTRDLF